MNRYCVLWLAVLFACICNCSVSLPKTSGEFLPLFANYRLAAAHLFFSLPIACLFACRFRDRWSVHRFSFILATVLTFALPYLLDSVSWFLRQMEAAFMLRSFIRCAISITIVFGWLVTIPRSISWNSKHAWSWTLLLSVILPSIYAWKHSENCRDEFNSSLAGMRIARAYHSLERLVETDGAKQLQGIDIEDWRRKLKREIVQSEQILVSAKNDKSLNGCLQRGMQSLSLSRYDDAERALLEARSTDPQVLLLLAITAREKKDHKKVESICRELLKVQSAENAEGKQMVFQLLGESLVGQRKIHTAITSYEQAIQQCHNYRGEFEMRLGTLLGEAGDVSGAIEHFEKATRVEPRLSIESKKRIRELQSNSCHL